MSYTVYAGQTEIYDQKDQFDSLLKRFDFDNYGKCFLIDKSCFDFVNIASGNFKVRTSVCGRDVTKYGLDVICIEIRIYIDFEVEDDAILFKLMYEPNKLEY